MNKLDDIIASINDLIELSEKKIKHLKELRSSYLFAEKFGVNANEIARVGYDNSRALRNRFQWYLSFDKQLQADLCEPNYCILKDGRRIDMPDPWESPLARREYVDWRKLELKKYMDGLYVARPDVSPAAWKHAVRTATEIPQPKPTA